MYQLSFGPLLCRRFLQRSW